MSQIAFGGAADRTNVFNLIYWVDSMSCDKYLSSALWQEKTGMSCKARQVKTVRQPSPPPKR
ncbi:hypothetical protein Csa_022041 [Cucumis sativus]|uniref:Uncharacterized protein n=1 Tax=Cucumis sativus TaxID=3659 RepID=A0A0A0LPU8_CUCSA|nr:hypothetical protein Csa_022041 [Cucumis sativus]